jgi:hypothetical protein
LPDHAAVSLSLKVEAVVRLDSVELLGGDDGMLF